MAKLIMESYLDESRQLGKIGPTFNREVKQTERGIIDGIESGKRIIPQKPNNPTGEWFLFGET